jgi:hypothetical protein
MDRAAAERRARRALLSFAAVFIGLAVASGAIWAAALGHP